MKRNKQSTRAMRARNTANITEGNSKYALKRIAGKQKYGPGCCAHGNAINHNQKLVTILVRNLMRFRDQPQSKKPKRVKSPRGGFLRNAARGAA